MDSKKERHNEISKLCERRRREWKKVSKMFLEILFDEKIEKRGRPKGSVVKTDEEKKNVMLKCVHNWVVNNRERHNSNVLCHMNKKNRWNRVSETFRKILI